MTPFTKSCDNLKFFFGLLKYAKGDVREMEVHIFQFSLLHQRRNETFTYVRPEKRQEQYFCTCLGFVMTNS